MPSINSARYTEWIIQMVKSRMSIVSEKFHRLDPPYDVDCRPTGGSAEYDT